MQDTFALLPKCKETFLVSYAAGQIFSSIQLHKNYIRLCFAQYDEQALENGVQRLAQAVKEQLAASKL